MSDPDTTPLHLSECIACLSFQGVPPSSDQVAARAATKISFGVPWDYPPYRHFAKQISPFYSAQNGPGHRESWNQMLRVTDSAPADLKQENFDVEHVFELQQLNSFLFKAKIASLAEKQADDPWTLFLRDGEGQGASPHPMSSIVAQPGRPQTSRTLWGTDHVNSPKWNIRRILAQCQAHKADDFVKLKSSINTIKGVYFGLKRPTRSSQQDFSDKLRDTLLLVEYLNNTKVAGLYLKVRRRLRKIIAKFARTCYLTRDEHWKLKEDQQNTWIDGFDKWEMEYLEQVEENILAALEYGLEKAGGDQEILDQIRADGGPLRLLRRDWNTEKDNLRLTEQGHWARVDVEDIDPDTRRVLTDTQTRLDSNKPGLHSESDTPGSPFNNTGEGHESDVLDDLENENDALSSDVWRLIANMVPDHRAHDLFKDLVTQQFFENIWTGNFLSPEACLERYRQQYRRSMSRRSANLVYVGCAYRFRQDWIIWARRDLRLRR